MTGFSAPCKKARPLAAPIAILNLVPHGNDTDNPEIIIISPTNLSDIPYCSVNSPVIIAGF